MHAGSGLGNQLFRYVGSRTLADNKFEGHAMVAPELFKGKDFMKLQISNAGLDYEIQPNTGKVILKDLKNINVIDAEFQSELDWSIIDVREWIKVEPMELPDDLCIISHRGGEYTVYPDLYLPQEYWDRATSIMREINPNMRFEVQTDDPISAKIQFPNFPIVHDMAHNWRSIRYAKHLIVGNSSFSILPSLMNMGVDKILAPKYHAGYNKGYWQEPNNRYRRYTYV